MYPIGTPKEIINGTGHFIDSQMLEECLKEYSVEILGGTKISWSLISRRLFKERGIKHARQKILDWRKWRYPAKDADFVRVINFLDPKHKYKRSDFWISNDSVKFDEALSTYQAHAILKNNRARIVRIKKEVWNMPAKGQESLFEETEQ